ncbi:hypothetical protein [Sedimentibacter sp.]|uniref:hypothetical protein n=1 Tax=Sedimentibacter sp. TaxID=1960295 RepID=UPI0028B23C81|nr:hypothetical protein [Sedimentibacter sp.]
MKLSRREKVLIIVLIISLIAYAGYVIIPSLNLFNLESLRSEYNRMSIEYNSMSQNILLKNKYEESIQTVSEEINSLNVISDLRQEKIIVFLNNYFTNNGIDANAISFTDATVVPVNIVAESAEQKEISFFEALMNDINGEVPKKDEAPNPEDLSEEQSLTVRQISVNITFESTYDELLKFIDSIQNNKVDISITNINIVSESNLIQGTIALNFYEVPKPEGFTESNDEWIWEDLAESGKNNPFVASSGRMQMSSGNYDFHMSIMPDSSDLPAVILGKSDDDSRTSYLYADGNAVESVNFEFKEEDGKYYYKYAAAEGIYPADGTWKEFTPEVTGNIYVKIYSSKRNSKADTVGVNIGVSNTSGLKPRFEIEGDDSTTRVFFRDPKSVTVIR